MPRLKLGNKLIYQVISPNFKTARVAKNNQRKRPFGAKLCSDVCPRKLSTLSARGNFLSFEEQTACSRVKWRLLCLLSFKYSFTIRGFLKIVNITPIFHSFIRGIFSHITFLRQSRARTNN